MCNAAHWENVILKKEAYIVADFAVHIGKGPTARKSSWKVEQSPTQDKKCKPIAHLILCALDSSVTGVLSLWCVHP